MQALQLGDLFLRGTALRVVGRLLQQAEAGDAQSIKLVLEKLMVDEHGPVAGAMPALEAQEAVARARAVAVVTKEAGIDFWAQEANDLEQLVDQMQGLTAEAAQTYREQARAARAMSRLCEADVALAKTRTEQIESLFGD